MKKQNIVLLMVTATILMLWMLWRFIFKANFKKVSVLGVSISFENARVIADDFESVMSSVGGKSKIIEILKDLSPMDKRQIYNAFGRRNYLFIGKWQLLKAFVGDEITLTEWFLKEFRGDLLEDLRKEWNDSGLTI